MFVFEKPRVLAKEPLRTYYVCFLNTNHPIRYLLKRNFTHVAVVLEDTRYFILLDPQNNKLRCDIVSRVDQPKFADDIKKYAHRVLKVTMYSMNNTRSRKRFGVMSCVSHACYFLGLKIRALTPYALYKKLIKLNTILDKNHGVQSVKILK